MVPGRGLAAALGTAAAAWLNKGSDGLLHFGPMTALANDLSTKPCTAGDVEIIGNGIIVNEPCVCNSGTFNAQVQFTVRNNTGTERYCVALHLVPDGTVLTQPLDLILRDSSGSSTAPAKSDTTMFATIPGFPCSAGLVCFGQAGVVRGKCAPGTCTTIAWNTSPGDANCTTPDQSPAGGQCRHQQVCIQGFGASLVCKSGCTPACGGQAVLTASVSGGVAPYTYCLSTDGKTCTHNGTCAQTFGPTSATSHDFTVTVTQNTTYTLTVTDSNGTGCCRDATTSLTATPITVNLAVAGNNNCNGVLTFTATVTGGSTCSFVWKVDGQEQTGQTGSTFAYGPTLDGNCHTVEVSATCGGCTGSASKSDSQCVTTTLNCGTVSAASADGGPSTNQVFLPLVDK
jgi:hypothetical protein